MSIREQVTWALGNIAGDCVANRDAIINSGCITNLINGLNDVLFYHTIIIYRKMLLFYLFVIQSGYYQIFVVYEMEFKLILRK